MKVNSASSRVAGIVVFLLWAGCAAETATPADVDASLGASDEPDGATTMPDDAAKGSNDASVRAKDAARDAMVFLDARQAPDLPVLATDKVMAFPSAQDNFKSFQTVDGCTGSTSELGGHSTCQTNASCQDGSQVTMCVRQGGSHCGNYQALGIVDIAWEMFQKQALP